MAEGYLLLTLGGVQAFVAASRRTADLWTSSRLMSRLCLTAVRAVTSAQAEPVLPVSAEMAEGLPNRLFAVVPDGDAARVANVVAEAVRTEWKRLAEITFGRTPNPDAVAGLATVPTVRWVAWDGKLDDGDDRDAPPDRYGHAWEVCQRASVARGRVRDFAPYSGRGRQPCSLCGVREGTGRGDASRRGDTTLPGRLRMADGERLCPVCAVKRDPKVTDELTGSRAAFPSTASVATAPFRLAVIERLAAAGWLATAGTGSGTGLTAPAAAVAAHQKAVADAVSALRAAGAEDVAGQGRAGAMPHLEAAASQVGGEALAWALLDGAWCLPGTWQAASLLHEHRLKLPEKDPKVAALKRVCVEGRRAVAELGESVAGPAESVAGPVEAADPTAAAGAPMATAPAPAPGAYLAFLLQDADGMGRSLAPERHPAGVAARTWHERVSTALVDVARAQSTVLEELSGRAVYAGGDDLLGMVPARHALRAAARCREVFLDATAQLVRRPSVSTAVVFFHASYPLQDALARARRAVDEEAKKRSGKAGLALVVLRRGGETAATVLPWLGRGGTVAADAVEDLAAHFRAGLSPKLAFDLHASRHGVAELAHARRDYGAEVRRLVARHAAAGLDVEAATASVRAVEPEAGRLGLADVEAWVGALDVARFVAQEAR